MINAEVINVFNSWLEKNERFGLILPDGWFGRPMDNIHKITWWIERDNKFIIELDNQLYISLTKPMKFRVDKTSLIISDFLQSVIDRQGYGDMKPHCKVYNSGDITFVGYK